MKTTNSDTAQSKGNLTVGPGSGLSKKSTNTAGASFRQVTLETLKGSAPTTGFILNPRAMIISPELELSSELSTFSADLHMSLYCFWNLENLLNLSYWPQLSFILIDHKLWLRAKEPVFSSLYKHLNNYPVYVLNNTERRSSSETPTVNKDEPENVSHVHYQKHELRSLIQNILIAQRRI